MRRRLLLAAVALTALALLLDLSGVGDLGVVRRAAAAALGPMERLVGPGATDPADAARLRAAVTGGTSSAEVDRLLATPGTGGTRVVLARVVAVGQSGPAGPERVTLDVGARDGVEVDRAVVAEQGLVGRVVSVAPWTCDVLLVGSPEVTVGVRVGAAGVLGEASGAAAVGAAAPDPGTLSLSLVERGAMAPGDPVVTLGSVGGRPFVPGIRVGTVRGVRTGVGRLAPSGTLVPAVDTTSLDLVAVLLAPARSTARPVLTPTPAPAR
ncbi:rod shape-determining protein MreC [Phycicoccus duodecadis]|uniref:Cell shape-determining protein MreC n=1 Tax=Phycicoccus duodecadis TaxID=173053 RepID=A0A2N3YMN7_9MICO|nr:rod shape-determining protein MreC [Phycicoccus duodecadis]PKW28068.1 rod shape-determining protein MreC [Phycicoccus duodecadis]